MTHPIDVLDHEHRVIDKVIAAMHQSAERLNAGAPVDKTTVAGFAPFLREFADACHHGKEEHRLFPLLLEKGLPKEGGPVQVMIAEHVHARELIAAMAKLADAYAAGTLADARPLAHLLDAIAGHYTQHIWKEDNVLFPMARRLMSDNDVARLNAEFAAVEAAHGEEVHEKHSHFAHSLAA